MTATATNRTTFQAALSNVLKSGEYVEGVSFSMLLALYEMETAFDGVWMKAYYASSGAERTETLEKTICELAPEYVDVVTAARTTDKALPTEPAKKAASIAARECARRRRKAAQNIMRNAVNGLVYLRTADLTKPPKINTYRKLDLVFKTADGIDKLSESFASLSKLGEAKAKELGWMAEAPSNRVTNAAPAGDAADKPENSGSKPAPTLSGSKGTVLAQQLQNMNMLLLSIDFAQLKDEHAELIRQMEETIIRKNYALENGRIDLKLLTEQYQDVKAISTGDNRDDGTAAAA
jgi:hypothetical protein